MAIPPVASLEFTFEYPLIASFDFQDASWRTLASEPATRSGAQTCAANAILSKTGEVSPVANSMGVSSGGQSMEITYVNPRGRRTILQWKGGETLSQQKREVIQCEDESTAGCCCKEPVHEGKKCGLYSSSTRQCGQTKENKPRQRMTKLARVKTPPRFGLGPCPVRPPQQHDREQKDSISAKPEGESRVDVPPRLPNRERKADATSRTPTRERMVDVPLRRTSKNALRRLASKEQKADVTSRLPNRERKAEALSRLPTKEREADVKPRQPIKECRADIAPTAPHKDLNFDTYDTPTPSQAIQLAILAQKYALNIITQGKPFCPPEFVEVTGLGHASACKMLEPPWC